MESACTAQPRGAGSPCAGTDGSLGEAVHGASSDGAWAGPLRVAGLGASDCCFPTVGTGGAGEGDGDQLGARDGRCRARAFPRQLPCLFAFIAPTQRGTASWLLNKGLQHLKRACSENLTPK